MDRPTLVTPGSSDGSTPLIVMNWLSAGALRQPKSEDDRRRGHDTRHGAHLPDLLVRLTQPSSLEHVDMRLRADDAITQLALEAGHQGQHDEERHHTDGHADGGDQRDERNEGLLPAGQQVADGDEELEGEVVQSLLVANPSSRSRTISLPGALPKKRAYSLLNCEALR